MIKTPLLDRLKYQLMQPHYPEIGLEFNSDSIRLAVVDVVKKQIEVSHLDSEPIAPGVLDINPFKPNILSLEPLTQALRALWSRNRKRDSKICMLLQDRVALTFNLNLEAAASGAQEFMDLIRFKLKKSVPFRIEESRINYFTPSGVPDTSGTNFWITLMHHSVLQQYESFVQSAIDVECGLVDLATLNAVNLSHEITRSNPRQQDLLYVNLNDNYISIAITQKGNLVFFRSRALEKQNGILEEALAEIHPTTMFYLDKLSGENLSEVFVYSPSYAEDLCARVHGDLGLKSSILTIDPYLGVRFDTSNKRLLWNFVPLVGLLVSRKVEFV